jgi:hypothetical protein
MMWGGVPDGKEKTVRPNAKRSTGNAASAFASAAKRV